MAKFRRSSFLSYSVAVASPSVALLIDLSIHPVTNETPFLLFVAAVMISTWYGGLGPGLLAIALSVLSSAYFLLPPMGSLDLSDLDDAAHLGIFVIVALLISSLHSRIRSSRAEAERLARSNQALLLSECQARAGAEAATRAKDEFLAMVSHELRNPLHSITGWLAILRSAGVSDVATAERALGVIERNVKLQKTLIEDLLDVSQIAAGKLRINATTVDMVRVINQTVETIRPGADEKQVRLYIKLDYARVFVSGDADRLEQLIRNLLSNAIKFTPAGGRVLVKLKTVGHELQLTVSDTGIGIPARFLPHIFERFTQSAEQKASQFGGLGLGLAIARHIVELHRGSIQALSPGAGGGSSFTVKLPLQRADKAITRLIDDARAIKGNPPLNTACRYGPSGL